jgi:hypothetical protein
LKTTDDVVSAATALPPTAQKAVAYVKKLKFDSLVDAGEIAKGIGCSSGTVNGKRYMTAALAPFRVVVRGLTYYGNQDTLKLLAKKMPMKEVEA